MDGIRNAAPGRAKRQVGLRFGSKSPAGVAPGARSRARLLILGGLGLVFALAMIGLMVFALLAAGSFVAQANALHHRLDVLARLQTDIETYTEKAAAVLLSGRGERDALEAARIKLERSFANLVQATEDEVATLGDMQAIQADLPEVGNSRRLLELYHNIDLSTNQMLQLQRQNQAQAAALVFQHDIEFRITNELMPLLGGSLTTEEDRAAAMQQDFAGLQTTLLAIAVGIAIVTLLALGLAGVRFQRRIRRELGALGAAAGAAEGSAALAAQLETTMAQLRDAQARLNAVDARQTQFLADIGHELRTPLTVLRGEADVALRGRADARAQRQSLERIRGEAVELGELLEQLLAYARPEAEGVEENFADIALDEVVLAAVQEGEILAGPLEVRIATDLTDGGCHLEADFRRLKQALLIGLDNAVKHAPPGSTIGVETARTDGQLAIRIIDEGPGVAADDLPHVFERFYRGKKEGESADKGLGLGLAIAREIIERHRGTIRLGNGPEGGAVLDYRLPIVRGAGR